MSKFLKGQIPIVGAILIASLTVIGGMFTSKITASSEVKSEIAKIEKTVAVVEEREENHYQEVQKQLHEVSEKLDKLLTSFQIK